MYHLYQRYDRAHKLLSECEKIYRCIEQVLLSVAAPAPSPSAPVREPVADVFYKVEE